MLASLRNETLCAPFLDKEAQIPLHVDFRDANKVEDEDADEKSEKILQFTSGVLAGTFYQVMINTFLVFVIHPRQFDGQVPDAFLGIMQQYNADLLVLIAFSCAAFFHLCSLLLSSAFGIKLGGECDCFRKLGYMMAISAVYVIFDIIGMHTILFLSVIFYIASLLYTFML